MALPCVCRKRLGDLAIPTLQWQRSTASHLASVAFIRPETAKNPPLTCVLYASGIGSRNLFAKNVRRVYFPNQLVWFLKICRK